MNIAWSTAAILALLLPGFFFIRGLGLAEPFSRDSTPRNPIALLAVTVLVSIVAHWAGLSLVERAGTPCDLTAVLSFAAGDLRSSEAVERVAAAIGPHKGKITWYFVLICGSMLGLGASFGKLAGRFPKWGGALYEHAWLHKLHEDRYLTLVYALTNFTYKERHVLYVGEIERFGVRQDGRFSFLILKNASRGRLTGDDDRSGMQWKPIKQDKVGQLYLDGESILNLFVEYAEFPISASQKAFRRAAIQALEDAAARPDTIVDG